MTSLLHSLAQYEETWAAGLIPYRSFDRGEECRHLNEFRNFVLEYPNCLERGCSVGHVTGSALVTDPSLTKVVLTLHRKLGKWLQLGGHCDDETSIHQTALREAAEESGLAELALVPFEPLFGPGLFHPLPLDLDIHEIPERAGEPSHLHFDARFLVLAPGSPDLHCTKESKELRWFSLKEAHEITQERSLSRQLDKLEAIRSRLKPGIANIYS